ncbi:hypothetical protein [Arenibacter echinorum]|uniref:Uncharacterized protein n=1 Tax=Arenibacter echinorum TaxID=440515 RepID=A0A327RGE4_9FLAO|nr:hypothetical protein [Arenibacter echinorum]RAJ15318.1 hypothetical protein LV92_00009 [Arenibacter echinorum]
MKEAKKVVLQGLVFSYQHVRMGTRRKAIVASSTDKWKSPDLLVGAFLFWALSQIYLCEIGQSKNTAYSAGFSTFNMFERDSP